VAPTDTAYPLLAPLPVESTMEACVDPLVTQPQAPLLVCSLIDPNHPVSPCVLVGSTWFAWYFLLDTFKLHVLESYASLSCSWVQQATTLPSVRQWIAWSDFPLPDSVLFHSTPIVLLIHGPPSLLEYLYPDWFERHHILFLAPAEVVIVDTLPFSLRVSHSGSRGVLEGH